jgi:hypothetical protein
LAEGRSSGFFEVIPSSSAEIRPTSLCKTLIPFHYSSALTKLVFSAKVLIALVIASASDLSIVKELVKSMGNSASASLSEKGWVPSANYFKVSVVLPR